MGVSNGKRPWPCEHRSGPSYLSSLDSDHGEENSDGSTSEGPSHTGQFGPASVLTCKIVIMLDSYMILALRPRPLSQASEGSPGRSGAQHLLAEHRTGCSW